MISAVSRIPGTMRLAAEDRSRLPACSVGTQNDLEGGSLRVRGSLPLDHERSWAELGLPIVLAMHSGCGS